MAGFNINNNKNNTHASVYRHTQAFSKSHGSDMHKRQGSYKVQILLLALSSTDCYIIVLDAHHDQ